MSSSKRASFVFKIALNKRCAGAENVAPRFNGGPRRVTSKFRSMMRISCRIGSRVRTPTISGEEGDSYEQQSTG